MTNQEYRSLPRVSNSDLSRFEDALFGANRPAPVQAFAFGSALHELILEPHTIHQLPEGLDVQTLQTMAQKVRQHPTAAWALQWSVKEKIVLWECPVTGLPLKSKLDLVYRGSTVYDLKSTAATSQSEFERAAKRYQYDRQAAFYLDSVQAKRYVIIGIQKAAPHQIYTIQATAHDVFITKGRDRYTKLLQAFKAANQKLPNT